LPAIGADNAGNFVIVWHGGYDGAQTGVFGRRFDASGAPRGVEFQVNVFTTNFQNTPAVSVDSDGDFVVVFASGLQDGPTFGVFGRRFTSSGAAVGVDFQVNAVTVGQQTSPSIGLDSDGDFVVAWLTDQGPDDTNVLVRRFNSTGVGGAEMAVSPFTGGEVHPRVGVDADGDFVVAWTGAGSGYGGGLDTFARRFNALGGPQGEEFLVNQYTWDGQQLPSVAVADDGDFVIAWSSDTQDGSNYGAFARAFDASGAAIGSDIQVNTYTPGDQLLATVASDDKGGFVVAWNGPVPGVGVAGVFGQRFATLFPLDVDGNGAFDALTDGLLILRFGFGFSGATLTTGAIGTGCTRCDAASITAYLQSIS
jgi:hypothetical protein